MGDILPVRPALRLIAITAGDESAIEWACQRAAQAWGEVAFRSPLFDFNQTNFYEAEMGPSLKKQLVAFAQLMDADALPDAKLLANEWEREYASIAPSSFVRPINVDPGYLTEAKLVLASTKDRDHRIYLRDGIYAEITLYFNQRQWRVSRWTYPDYQQPAYFDFFNQAREFLRRRLGEFH